MLGFDEIVQAAQRGVAIHGLRKTYGLSEAQAASFVDAAAPFFAVGLQHKADEGQSPIEMAQRMWGLGTANGRPFDETKLASSGSGMLDWLFTPPGLQHAVAERAASQSGLNTQEAAQILPAMAALMFGTFTAMLTGAAPHASGPSPAAAEEEPVSKAGFDPIADWARLMDRAVAGFQPQTQDQEARVPDKPAERTLPDLGVAVVARVLEAGERFQNEQLASARSIFDAFIGDRKGSSGR